MYSAGATNVKVRGEHTYRPVGTPQARPKEKKIKIAVIIEANAVPNPRTVVVHVKHALLANTAMVGARRLR